MQRAECVFQEQNIILVIVHYQYHFQLHNPAALRAGKLSRMLARPRLGFCLFYA